jgi:hypothetical protein
MVFVWSDDLALLLRDEGEASTRQLGHWISSPIGYRLPEGTDPVTFARDLLRRQDTAAPRQRAS